MTLEKCQQKLESTRIKFRTIRNKLNTTSTWRLSPFRDSIDFVLGYLHLPGLKAVSTNKPEFQQYHNTFLDMRIEVELNRTKRVKSEEAIQEANFELGLLKTHFPFNPTDRGQKDRDQ